MHRHEKITFMECATLDKLPDFKMHTVDCPKCHYRHAVPPEYCDWKEVAATYQQAYESMTKRFFAELKEAGEQFDVPLVEYFETSRQLMIAELKAIVERLSQPPTQ